MLPYPSVDLILFHPFCCFFPSKLLCFHVANSCPMLTSGIQAQNQKALSGDRTLALVYLKAQIIHVTGSGYFKTTTWKGFL